MIAKRSHEGELLVFVNPPGILVSTVMCPGNRELVLDRVSDLVKKFVRTVFLSQGLSGTAANAAGGKFFTFGSYHLGVRGPGTEIDTLCVVPKPVSREDFFNVFEPMLRETEGITDISVR